MKKLTLICLSLTLLSATPAFAHLNPNEHGSFAAGFTHPLFGMDHILAMVAVGLWAWQIGQKALWAVPAAFVGTMVLGFVLALGGAQLPFVEPAILASVVALGLLVALAVKLPVSAGAAIVGVFALFHGYAHGGEIGAATQFGYGAGFAIATALLHGAGIAAGYGLNAVFKDKTRIAMTITRVLGGLTFIAGIGLMTAA